MNLVSQKCQYALRAVFELARNADQGPMKIAAIAKAQAIPPRFLEVILSQLKKGGFVRSRRGNEGGYELTRDPSQITVGEVIMFIEGPLGPVDCLLDKAEDNKCPLYSGCVFLPMWERVKDSVADIYNTTSIMDLVEQDKKQAEKYVPSYAI